MAFENDWAFLRAALPELKNYILSNDLYWPLRLNAGAGGSAQSPQLTVGNLALTLARLSAPPLQGAQAAELAEITQRIQALREEWRSNWGRKAGKEYSSRLNLWQQYMRELRGDTRGQAAYYANEVRQRTILQLLLPEILESVPAHVQDQVTMLDGVLRGLTAPGPFVWEPEVQGSFPQPEYWFLYVTFTR